MMEYQEKHEIFYIYPQLCERCHANSRKHKFKFRRKKILQNVSFSVPPGSITGLLGPNGSGKSSLFKTICGFITPDSGKALLSGSTYAELKFPLNKVGTFLDQLWFHPKLSLIDHLSYMAATNNIPKHRIETCIQLVGLDSVKKRKTQTFSLGMKQRAGLACALLGDPDIIILDEPTNGLDIDGQQWFKQLVSQLIRNDKTILLSTHLLQDISFLADHIVILGQGKVLYDNINLRENNTISAIIELNSTDNPRFSQILNLQGIKTEFIENLDPLRAKLIVHNADSLRIQQLAAEHGIAINNFSMQARSELEQLYTKITEESIIFRGQ